MAIEKISFSNDPNIGLYGFATDEYCLVGDVEHKYFEKLKDTLDVKIIKTKISGTNFAGMFSTGNSSGIVVPEIIKKHELDNLKKDFEVIVIRGRYTALGNLILMNDKGIVISKKLEGYKNKIEETFNLKVSVGNIGGLDIIGSLAVCNNNGCLVSKFADSKNLDLIQSTLKVKTEYSTVNFGSNFVKSGVITNSKGLLTGELTSGPEMDRISETLGV